MTPTPALPPGQQALSRHSTPWLLAATLLAIAPHALHQPLWLSALAALTAASAGFLWWQRRPLPPAWLRTLGLVLVVGGILREYGSLFGRDPGVGLLLALATLKLLELRQRRDALAVICLGYFLLLTHYFHAQDLLTGLWLLLTLWVNTTALVRLGSEGSPLAVPAPRLAGRLILQGLPLMLVLYLLFPRLEGPLWHQPEEGQKARTGLSDTLSPGSISALAEDNSIAFRVRFDGPLPLPRQLYWRGPVMEHFDGQRWRPSQAPAAPPRLQALSPPLPYEMTLEAHQQRWLLALDAATVLPPDSRFAPALSALAAQPLQRRQRLNFSSVLDYRFNIEEAAPVLQRNLALPGSQNPRARALGQGWRESIADPAGRVEAARRHLATKGFAYTLSPPALGADPVDQFLFDTRLGFCEHYASAFVFLMRAAGVPARVVTGYQGGELNPLDAYLVVRQSNAHAWTEVWLAGTGWQRIDPTALVAPARLDSGVASGPAAGPAGGPATLSGDWLRGLRWRWEAMNNMWNQYVLGYDPLLQRTLLARAGLADADWRSLGLLLGAGCGLLLALLAVLLLYRRPPRPDPLLQQWQIILRALRRRGIDAADWEAPLALAARVQAADPVLGAALQPVLAAYLAARYGAAADCGAARQARWPGGQLARLLAPDPVPAALRRAVRNFTRQIKKNGARRPRKNH